MAMSCVPKNFLRLLLLLGTALPGTALAGTVSDVIPWGTIPVHAALTPDGRVMTFGATPQDGQGGFDYILWDPSKGTGSSSWVQLPNGVNFNSFCVGGVLDPATGKIILAGGGGDSSSAGSATHGVGYDFTTSKLSSSQDLRFPRYYASITTLPDGRLLITGGSPPYGNQTNASGSAEIFTSGKGWTVLPGTDSSPLKQGGEVATGNPFWYPHQFPIGNNELFVVAGKFTHRLSYAGQGSYRDVKNVTESNWGASSTAVMYRPGIFMQIGGGTPGNNFDNNPGSSTVTIYDLRAAIADPNKAIGSRNLSMRLKRHFANSTVLANGEVLVSGGSEGNNTLVNVANRTEIYNPDTDQWRLDAALQRPRLYHSIALLMKDGRVLTGGGGIPGPINARDIEIYTPDYLLDKNGQPAKRPSIIDGPKTALSLGQTFRITADKPIKRVTIVKTGVVTHSYNTDQRFFEGAFTATGNSADILFPNDAVNATPGVYMVFAFDADGVPSVGKFVRLKSPTGDTGYALPNDMPTSPAPVGTARPASGWAFCAHEGERCPVEGTQQVRYGANGNYRTMTVSNQATCSNAAFGGDPVPGVFKACEILANSYGKLTTYDPSNATTSTSTTNTSGGTSSSVTGTMSGTWTACATEGGTCKVSGTQQVRYGANSNYRVMNVTNQTACTNDAFGGDPLYGVVKSCEVMSSTSGTSSTSNTSRQLTVQHSGMCLSAPQNNANGQRVVQATCNASDPRQFWTLKTTEGGYNVVSQSTGRCLDVSGISTADGAEIQQWDCWGGKNQAFAFDPNAARSTMKAVHSGKCVAVPASSKVNGSLIIQWACYNGAEQLWSLK